MNTVRTLLKRAIAAAVGAAAMIAAAPTVLASNHSDAPLIKQDPQANLTDVYAFIGTQYNNPSIKVLNVSMSFRPFSEPGDGAQYERFADDARYSIHITDPTSGATKLRYDFIFSPVDEGYKNKNTAISYGLGTEVGPIVAVGDARQNFTQTFQVLKAERRSLPGPRLRSAHAASERRQSCHTRLQRPCDGQGSFGRDDVVGSRRLHAFDHLPAALWRGGLGRSSR